MSANTLASSNGVRLLRLLTLAALLLCFAVVVLGGYVRLSAAGLGCPDWPGCYGHATPLGAQASIASQAAYPGKPLDLGKAWREMIHRYAAGTLGSLILAVAVLLLLNRRVRPATRALGVGLLGIVVFQALLGMLTVTWQVTPPVVTLHLLFGLTTLGLLWWLWLSLPVSAWTAAGPGSGGGAPAALHTAHRLAVAGFVVLCMQIALGGWTSTNYAAIACPDFPTCQNAWWPHSDYRDAFVLWRGLGVNYEGGVLDNAARVAIHLTHRIGALVAALTLAGVSLYVLTRGALSGAHPAAVAVLLALALQLAIGISMVLYTFPIALATAHTAGAALLLLATLALVRRLRTR